MAKIHRAIQFPNGTFGETFCHIPFKCEGNKFIATRSNKILRVVTQGREADFNCNTCWHVYRKIKPND